VTIPAGEGDLTGEWTSEATYKPDGSPDTQTYPAVGGMPEETLTHTYDDTGVPLTLTGQGSYVSATSFDPWGTVKQRTLGAAGKRVRQTITVDESTRRLFKLETHTENQTHMPRSAQPLRKVDGSVCRADGVGQVRELAVPPQVGQ
jgi:hypothetical protein